MLARLMTLHPKSIDLALDRIERLLGALGNPQGNLPPVIHVAGTNGKGSVIAFLRACLEAGGKRVHAYTSPHLRRFHERIVVAGEEIGEQALVDALNACEQANEGQEITFFEITTAAAFHVFAHTPADAVLLETGLGGRFDATNVVDRPALTVITPVSRDHQDFLGHELELIAREKAGILKAGVPCVVGPQEDAARRVIEQHAEKTGSPLIIWGQEFSAHEEHGRLVYQDESGLLDLPLPRLQGRHQIANAGTAIACLRALNRFGIAEDTLARGLRRARWRGRLERVRNSPLTELAFRVFGNDDAVEVWYDGAHNPLGARALAEAMADIEERAPMPLFLILGMLQNKDIDGFLAAFTGLARRVIGVPVPNQPTSRSARDVTAAAEKAGIAALPAENLQEAMEHVLNAAADTGGARVLITGSLYLAAEALGMEE
ncbi:MAG: bifunctional folylpolyglutamate synthase/dihydrofolate synthase [Alphaproteobacteria bacterium]